MKFFTGNKKQTPYEPTDHTPEESQRNVEIDSSAKYLRAWDIVTEHTITGTTGETLEQGISNAGALFVTYLESNNVKDEETALGYLLSVARDSLALQTEHTVSYDDFIAKVNSNLAAKTLSFDQYLIFEELLEAEWARHCEEMLIREVVEDVSEPLDNKIVRYYKMLEDLPSNSAFGTQGGYAYRIAEISYKIARALVCQYVNTLMKASDMTPADYYTMALEPIVQLGSALYLDINHYNQLKSHVHRLVDRKGLSNV